jgi:hypothetical protein
MAHAWVNVTYLSDAEYNAWAAEHKPIRESRAATTR